MKLLNAVLRPGKVIENLGNGNIKVEAPGLFSAEDKDKLPPVMPFFGGHSNSFSEPLEGDDIWVLNVTDNPRQLFWFRRDNRTPHNESIEKGTNVEVICNREAGLGYATIYFSDGSGWVVRNNDSYLQILNDGNIILDTGLPHRCIHINPNSISIGSKDKSSHPVAYGDVIQNALQDISACLNSIRNATRNNPYTLPIALAIGITPEKLNTAASTVGSNNVTVD